MVFCTASRIAKLEIYLSKFYNSYIEVLFGNLIGHTKDFFVFSRAASTTEVTYLVTVVSARWFGLLVVLVGCL